MHALAARVCALCAAVTFAEQPPTTIPAVAAAWISAGIDLQLGGVSAPPPASSATVLTASAPPPEQHQASEFAGEREVAPGVFLPLATAEQARVRERFFMEVSEGTS
jgi:hypothetical protein